MTTKTITVEFYDAGIGEPMPYDLSDYDFSEHDDPPTDENDPESAEAIQAGAQGGG